MTDTLDTALDALGRVPSPLRWDDVSSRRPAVPTASPVPPGPPSRRPALVVTAAAVVLLIAVAALVLTTDDDGDQINTEPGPSTSSTTTTSTTAPTTTIPVVTAQPARGQTVVTAVTDDAYLVWGGEDGTSEIDRVDGFAVDLEYRTVSTIPDAPISPSDGGDGVWTGSELVVWSAVTPQAAAWDPVERRWRMVTAPPADVRAMPSASVWAGDRIVAVGPGGAASYDPAEDTWSEIPRIPGQPTVGPPVAMAWTGEEVVAWVRNAFSGPYPSEEGGTLADGGWSWVPGDDAWSPLPDLPVGSRISYGSMVWTGSQILVWGTATGGDGATDVGVGALWSPGDDGWRPIEPSPQGRGEGDEGTQGSQSLAADPTTGRVLVHPLDLGGGVEDRVDYFYDPGTDTWAYAGPLLDGYAPVVSYQDGLILQPDPATPTIGPL